MIHNKVHCDKERDGFYTKYLFSMLGPCFVSLQFME